MEKYPTVCNICGGKVDYVSNEEIYGRKYGSGYAYLCSRCGAYVGTHKPQPKVALGILANADMRRLKIECHDMFDSIWKTSGDRASLYEWLANEMGIPLKDCHFGYFDLQQLNRAKEILKNYSQSLFG